MHFVKFLAFLFLLVFSLSTKARLSGAQIDELKKSIVFIDTSTKEFDYGGTGFFISPFLLATNYHIVKDLEPAKVVFNKGEKNERHLKAKVKAVSIWTDLAILELEEKTEVPYLELGSAKDLIFNESAPLVSLGYPDRAFKKALGYAVLLQYFFREKDQKEYYKLFTSIQSDYGASGSPLISLETGKVLGIIRDGHLDGTAEAILVDHLKNLKDKGTTNIEQDLISQKVPAVFTKQGLFHFWDGQFQKAFSSFNKASKLKDPIAQIWLMPFYHYGIDELYFRYTKKMSEEFGNSLDYEAFLKDYYEKNFIEIKKDPSQVAQIKEEVFKHAHYSTLILLFDMFVEFNELDQALSVLEKGVEKGFSNLTVMAAIFYEKGIGVKPDLDKAHRLYRKVLDRILRLENYKDVKESFPQSFLEFYEFVKMAEQELIPILNVYVTYLKENENKEDWGEDFTQLKTVIEEYDLVNQMQKVEQLSFSLDFITEKVPFKSIEIWK